jgi:hypothetical protein
VTTYEEPTGDGTGSVFHDLRPDSLADTIGWVHVHRLADGTGTFPG